MKILLLLSMTHLLHANEPAPSAEVWKTGSLFYSFVKDESSGAMVSENCLQNKKTCEALKAIAQKKKVKLSESDRSGGKNPGAVVCKKEYAGEILILKNNAGEENAFCKFKDNTQTSASELY